MDRAQLYKLTELIVAEVVRRIAQEERRRQHPEQVLVLLADSVSFPEKRTRLQTRPCSTPESWSRAGCLSG